MLVNELLMQQDNIDEPPKVSGNVYIYNLPTSAYVDIQNVFVHQTNKVIIECSGSMSSTSSGSKILIVCYPDGSFDYHEINGVPSNYNPRYLTSGVNISDYSIYDISLDGNSVLLANNPYTSLGYYYYYYPTKAIYDLTTRSITYSGADSYHYNTQNVVDSLYPVNGGYIVAGGYYDGRIVYFYDGLATDTTPIADVGKEIMLSTRTMRGSSQYKEYPEAIGVLGDYGITVRKGSYRFINVKDGSYYSTGYSTSTYNYYKFIGGEYFVPVNVDYGIAPVLDNNLNIVSCAEPGSIIDLEDATNLYNGMPSTSYYTSLPDNASIPFNIYKAWRAPDPNSAGRSVINVTTIGSVNSTSYRWSARELITNCYNYKFMNKENFIIISSGRSPDNTKKYFTIHFLDKSFFETTGWNIKVSPYDNNGMTLSGTPRTTTYTNQAGNIKTVRPTSAAQYNTYSKYVFRYAPPVFKPIGTNATTDTSIYHTLTKV